MEDNLYFVVNEEDLINMILFYVLFFRYFRVVKILDWYFIVVGIIGIKF